MFASYDEFDALGLAELVRNKEVSAKELCEEAISRAESVHSKLNAIITPMYELAIKQTESKLPDGPFSGVPFLLKDAHHAFKGIPMSQGCRALKRFVPDFDAEIVKRFNEAGLVVIGKTNTPEFKLSYVTEPEAFGPTRNPWQPEYTCGGSSGGSAAAVAAHIVPMASATDEGGSIRVPASCCGLFGLKPSRGRNPVGPDFNEELDGMSTSHVITRSVRDSAAMLDAIMGPEPGAPYTIAPPKQPYLKQLAYEPGRLLIAFTTNPVFGKPIHPEAVKAVEEAVKLLEQLGHNVEEAAPDYQEVEAAISHVMVIAGHIAVRLEEISQLYGRSVAKREVELQNLVLAAMGRNQKSVDFIRAKRKWREFGHAMTQFHQKYDLFLTPTLGQPPVLVGSQAPSKGLQLAMRIVASWIGRPLLTSQAANQAIVKGLIDILGEQMPCTMIANITGQPAMSVPLHWTDSGLPFGIQFIGRFGDEATLFQLAAQLEKARPWFNKKPQVCS